MSKRPPHKHLGSHAEHIARAFLLREGYEVFANISDRGYADLVAWKPGEGFLPVDVKSIRRVDGACRVSRLTREQWKAGVVSLCVDENDHCTFNPEQEQLRPIRPVRSIAEGETADCINRLSNPEVVTIKNITDESE